MSPPTSLASPPASSNRSEGTCTRWQRPPRQSRAGWDGQHRGIQPYFAHPPGCQTHPRRNAGSLPPQDCSLWLPALPGQPPACGGREQATAVAIAPSRIWCPAAPGNWLGNSSMKPSLAQVLPSLTAHSAHPGPTSSAPVMATKLATASPGSMAPSAVQPAGAAVYRLAGRPGWAAANVPNGGDRRSSCLAASGLHQVWRQRTGRSNSVCALRACPGRAQQQQGRPANRLGGRPPPPPAGPRRLSEPPGGLAAMAAAFGSLLHPIATGLRAPGAPGSPSAERLCVGRRTRACGRAQVILRPSVTHDQGSWLVLVNSGFLMPVAAGRANQPACKASHSLRQAA